MHMAARALAAAPVNHPKDTGQMLRGFFAGIKPGLVEAAGVLRGKDLVKFETKYNVTADFLEALYNRDIKGAKQAFKNALSMWKYVFRALKAGDAFFYRTASEGRAHLAASRVARNESNTQEEYAEQLAEQLHGSSEQARSARERAETEVEEAFGDRGKENDIQRRTYEIMEQARLQEIRDEARDFGLLTTFTNDPEGAIGFIAKQVNRMNSGFVIPTKWGDIPVTRPFIPFVNIVANVANASLDFSPIGVGRGLKGSHLVGRNPKRFTRQERLERGAAGVIGTSALTVVAQIASSMLEDDDPNFAVYGMGPSDGSKRKQLMAAGWRPFTVKIGDKYWKYNETPLAIGMSLIGGWHDKVRWDKRFDEKEVQEKMGMMFSVTAASYAETGFLQGISDLVETATGSDPSGLKVFKTGAKIAKGLIPGQGLLRDALARPFDPEVIDNDSVWASFIRDVPWVQRIGTKPMLNAFGDPIRRTGEERLPILSRFATSSTEDADWLWLVQNKVSLAQSDGDINVAVAHASEYEKFQTEQILEKRQKTLGRFAYDVLTDEEAYELHQHVGKRVRQLVRETRAETPKLTARNREDVQEEFNKGVREIKQEEKANLLSRKYPVIMGN
jgi:hypothetical protein